jgi:hypothetical protein
MKQQSPLEPARSVLMPVPFLCNNCDTGHLKTYPQLLSRPGYQNPSDSIMFSLFVNAALKQIKKNEVIGKDGFVEYAKILLIPMK